MGYRKHPIFPEQIYHVFNRGVASQPIFYDNRDYLRFLNVANFYRFVSPGLRFSYYNRLTLEGKSAFLGRLEKKGEKQVAIFVFCLIPNHFHFLIKELVEHGIQRFASNLQNSYAKYLNTKNRRSGALFQEMFKAVRIETDEQLLHTARYIHLNPFTSFLIKKVDNLKDYRWSSLRSYLGEEKFDFLETDFLNGFFSSKEKFKSFTYDQADYQRKLGEIKHLTFE